MKKIVTYIVVFLLGLLLGFYYLWNSKKDFKHKQIDIISNGIKNVSKLIVTEAEYTEIYNYQDANKYFFETLEFEKKVILLIHAKVQVSYDLRKLDYKIDSIHKRIVIKQIPKEEINIFPTYKYYDLQQSMWNTFTKKELNQIQKNSYNKLLKTVEISDLKVKARKRLLEELRRVISTAELFDWKVVDGSENLLTNEAVLNKLLQKEALD